MADIVYIVVYLILCIITSVLMSYLLGGMGFEDSLFIGFVSAFSPIVLPLLIIGIIGQAIYNKLEGWII